MHLNSGQPWTETEVHDLKEALAWGKPVAEIADTMLRDLFDVVAKMNELGAFRSNVRRLQDRRRAKGAGTQDRPARRREEGWL